MWCQFTILPLSGIGDDNDDDDHHHRHLDGATMAEEKSNSRVYSVRVAPPDKGFPNIRSMLVLMTRSEIVILIIMVGDDDGHDGDDGDYVEEGEDGEGVEENIVKT